MLAIPVKTNQKNPAVNTLFGKSKWFAFVDEKGNIEIEANTIDSGRAVVEYMAQKGVTQLIFNHMGGNPFMLLQRAKIECYHSGHERIVLDEVVQKFQNNQLQKVDGSNMADFVEQSNMHNRNRDHGHNNHHNHHHHNHEHAHDHKHHHDPAHH
jgi:predicted Fe-Mo cluster-binding NifX family protein